MWNPTPSLSKASSSDNKQNIREQVEIDDCKCSGGGIEQLHQQQQINNSKHKSTLLDHQEETKDNDKKLLELSGETIDSGFISGPQTSSAAYLEADNEKGDSVAKTSETSDGDGESKKLNIPESKDQPHNKEELNQPNLDSGIIEEDFEVDDIEESQKMKLPNSVESGISEWFCNMSLNNNSNAANTLSSASNSRTNPSMTFAGTGLNNLGAPKQPQIANKLSVSSPSSSAATTVQQIPSTPQHITPANAWEKYFQQNDDGDT